MPALTITSTFTAKSRTPQSFADVVVERSVPRKRAVKQVSMCMYVMWHRSLLEPLKDWCLIPAFTITSAFTAKSHPRGVVVERSPHASVLRKMVVPEKGPLNGRTYVCT